MSSLSELQFEPIPDSLARIYESLPDDTLAEEQERLRLRFLDIGSRLAGITRVRGEE